MRLILAAAALTALALPAQAQRLDTRRINIESDKYHTKCGFSSYPELTLVTTRNGNAASWVKAPEGVAPDAGVILSLAFSPAKGGWQRPAILVLMLTGPMDSGVSAVARGRLRVDGEPGVPMSFSSRPDKFMMMAGNNGNEAVYSMIDHSKRAEIDLLDSNGAVVRTYSWDTSRLADAVETVSVVGWSCTSP